MLYTDIKKFSKLLFFFYERKNKFVQRLIMTKGKAEQGSPINVNLKFFLLKCITFLFRHVKKWSFSQIRHHWIEFED